jgi:nucleoside phosphorylase
MPGLTNRRVGIVMALKREMKGFSSNWIFEEKKGERFLTYLTTFKDIEIILCISGLGKARAAACTQYMIDRHDPDIIINAGSAGGVCPKLKLGEIFIAGCGVEYDFKSLREKMPVIVSDDFFLDIASVLKIPAYVLGSADSNADTTETKGALHKIGIAAADWEGTAILKICKTNSKSAAIIKVITDTSSSDFEREFADNVFSFSQKLSVVVREFIKRCYA